MIAFCLIFGATLGCKNNVLSKLKEPKSSCKADLPKLDSAAEYEKRGSGLIHDKDYDCAFDDCQKALDLDSKNVDALMCRGYVYRQQQKYDLAENDFNEAVRLDPNSPFPYSQRGQLYRETEQLDKALADVNRAIELSPFYIYYERRARIYAELKDFEHALKDYTEAIRQKPETDYYYQDRAEIYRTLGKTDLAEADEIKYKELQAQQELKSGAAVRDYHTVLNNLAVILPKPEYPPAARAVKADGTVKVGIKVDEKGNVVAAQVISGHPLLQPATEKAARQAKFKPTAMGGILTYDFSAE